MTQIIEQHLKRVKGGSEQNIAYDWSNTSSHIKYGGEKKAFYLAAINVDLSFVRVKIFFNRELAINTINTQTSIESKVTRGKKERKTNQIY